MGKQRKQIRQMFQKVQQKSPCVQKSLNNLQGRWVAMKIIISVNCIFILLNHSTVNSFSLTAAYINVLALIHYRFYSNDTHRDGPHERIKNACVIVDVVKFSRRRGLFNCFQ